MPSPPFNDKSGHVRKGTTRKMRRHKVLRILAAAMENAPTSGSPAAPTTVGGSSSSDYHNEFFNTGRVGRRNAMPDILGQHCTTSTADLPDQLGAMSTQDSPSPGPSSSSNSAVTKAVEQSTGVHASAAAAAAAATTSPSTSS